MNYIVKVDVSPIYELMASFMVYTSKKWTDNMDMGPEWVQQVDHSLAPNIRTSLAPASSWPFSDFDVLYTWAIHRQTGNSIDPFLDHLLLCSDDYLFDIASSYLPSLTVNDTRRIRDDYTPLLKLWYLHYFRNIEDEITPLIEEDALEKSTLISKMDPENLIEYASGGLIVEDIADLQTVILFPTVHNRPINTYCFYKGMLLIQYPVDVPEDNEDEPPMCLTRMTHALSDPNRLRLLRYVADQPKSLNDMKKDLDEPKETLMHHLMILRVAGFLRIHLGNHDNEKFSIRPDGVAELQIFLESYIHL
ncbi:ArsR/SmtB family transcription factor [Paenibacillus crassostreae]|uniref:ArsR family transcriptional regulator n=1 Tax=Paenibacillus crassostreae TaxID=1763538 RepID=A0A167DTF6_9BACL|nr:helix-turn-helix domain-containing protein [Paenibacillus crassostreae]AOZ91084.1 ArsR family transcriptional regulator [Paenibacillus crassostreae]OAB74756.1 ArsR family transcriptional regulator [Paenibacillus crassostreae]